MEPYYGQIKLFPYDFEPEGWALCNGQLLQIEYNTALFVMIGTKFGGDGTKNFALPDLRQAEPKCGQCHYYIALAGQWPTRD